MKSLIDFYNYHGQATMSKLLNSRTVITEKLTGAKFSVLKTSTDLYFFKRDDRYPLNKLDRTLTTLYEKPIEYIESLKLNDNYNDTQFCFEYFHNNKPGHITYDNMPQNGLILTHVRHHDNDDTITINNEPHLLRMWADKLRVDVPVVYFDGILANEHQMSILDYIETGNTSDIISSLCNKTATLGDKDSDIEGVIIEFDDYQTKIVNEYSRPPKENPAELELLLYSFTEWAHDVNIVDDFNARGESYSEKYIDITSKIITEFILHNLSFVNGLNIKKPLFALSTDFTLNTKFIESSYIKSYIAENNDKSDIYKLLMGLYRKPRTTKPTYLMDESSITKMNETIQLIKDKSSSNDNNTPNYIEWKKYVQK